MGKQDKLKTRIAPPTVLIGVFRYQHVIGDVYVKYNEHTRKLVGLATQVAHEFTSCGLDKLIKTVNESESKERGKGR